MRHSLLITILAATTLLLAACNLFCGSVSIPAELVLDILTGGEAEKASWHYIVIGSRLPQTITAMLCGAALAVSGLMLQTAFRNPLAGPSILGITNGASLGVALVMLFSGGVLGSGMVMGDSVLALTGVWAVIMSAFLGALMVIALLLSLSQVINSNMMLLILGIMVSYLTSSVVALLNYFADSDNVHSYVMWGMGSFGDVTLKQLPWFAGTCLVGLVLAILQIKPLNALLLGNNYAASLGVNIHRTMAMLLIATGLLTASATAFCGPVAFIGLAVPHIARLTVRTADHRILVPATILTGSALALLCNVICILPENTIIPINAVTPLFGAPVIIYIIWKEKG